MECCPVNTWPVCDHVPLKQQRWTSWTTPTSQWNTTHWSSQSLWWSVMTMRHHSQRDSCWPKPLDWTLLLASAWWHYPDLPSMPHARWRMLSNTDCFEENWKCMCIWRYLHLSAQHSPSSMVWPCTFIYVCCVRVQGTAGITICAFLDELMWGAVAGSCRTWYEILHGCISVWMIWWDATMQLTSESSEANTWSVISHDVLRLQWFLDEYWLLTSWGHPVCDCDFTLEYAQPLLNTTEAPVWVAVIHSLCTQTICNVHGHIDEVLMTSKHSAVHHCRTGNCTTVESDKTQRKQNKAAATVVSC